MTQNGMKWPPLAGRLTLTPVKKHPRLLPEAAWARRKMERPPIFDRLNRNLMRALIQIPTDWRPQAELPQLKALLPIQPTEPVLPPGRAHRLYRLPGKAAIGRKR